jgi:hypothetical protein
VAALSRLDELWRDVWFPAVPIERVAIFRIAVAAFALIDVVVFSNYLIGYTAVDPVFFDPVYLLAAPSFLGIDALPVPTGAGYLVLYTLMIAALVSAVIGYRTRVALALAAPLYLYHWVLFNSWGKINHGKIPVIFALFVLIVAPAGGRLAVDAVRRRRAAGRPDERPTHDRLAGWALRVVGVLVVGSYLFSVYAKLVNSGLGWPLEPILAVEFRAAAHPLGLLLAEQRQLLVVLQGVTLVAEAAAVFAFAGGWRRNLVLLTLGGMHVGSYVLLGTEFFAFILCYLVFFRLEDGLAWLRLRLAGSRAPQLSGTA